MEESLVSDADINEIQELLANPRLMVPVDEVIAPPGTPAHMSRVEMLDGRTPFEAVLDNGPETITQLEAIVANAKTVLWNGPLGNYENGYTEATERLARAIAKSHAYSIIGGGDTIAAVEKLGLSGRFSFISTGGGAMLDFIASGTLPGLSVLR